MLKRNMEALKKKSEASKAKKGEDKAPPKTADTLKEARKGIKAQA